MQVHVIPEGASKWCIGENRIKESGNLRMAPGDIGIDANLGGELAIPSAPIRRRHGKAARDRMGAPHRKDAVHCPPQSIRIKCGQRGDEHEIDQILFSGAPERTVAVGARIGMQLLGDMLLQGQHRHGDGLDRGESKQARQLERLRSPVLRGCEADVDDQLLEEATCQFGAHMVAGRFVRCCR